MADRNRLTDESPEIQTQRMLAQELMSKVVIKKGEMYFCGDKKQKLAIMAKGERGDRGFNGLVGLSGKDGKDGRDGIDGKDGRNGKDGKNGEDGYTPILGVDYSNGLNGAAGKDGKDGIDGINGYEGTNGKDGVDGKDGSDGLVGAMPDHKWNGTKISFQRPDGSWGTEVDLLGPAAADGRNGIDGKNGLVGERGYPGPQGKTGSPGIPPSEIAYFTNELLVLKARLAKANIPEIIIEGT